MTLTDTRWERDFTLALRSRDITGTAIGAALEEVRAHCAETGESATDAFGPPRAYAESLAFAPGSVVPPGVDRLLAPVLLAVGALWVLPSAGAAWLLDEPMRVSVGQLVAVAVALVAGALCPWGLRVATRHPRWAVGGLVLVAWCVVLPVGLLRGAAFAVGPVLPAVVAGGLLLAAVGALVLALGREPVDEVVGPFDERARRTGRVPRAVRLAPLALLVVAAVLTWVTWAAGTA